MRYTDTVIGMGPSLEDWLRKRVDEAEMVAMRTGFLTLASFRGLEAHFAGLLRRGGRLLVVAGGAADQADPDALVRLGAMMEPYGDRAALRVVVDPEEFQNAKTYYLRFPDGHAEAWIGSANLTRGGLSANHEAAVSCDSRVPDDAHLVEHVLTGIEAFRDRPGTTAVSEETRLILSARRTRRQSQRHKATVNPTLAWETGCNPSWTTWTPWRSGAARCPECPPAMRASMN